MNKYITIYDNNKNFTFKLSDDYMGYFLSFINENTYNNKISKFALNHLAKHRTLGVEYYLCTYNENDFGYKPDKVTLIFWKPIDEEDTIIYFDKNVFYEYLLNACEETIKNFPEDGDEIYESLKIIKKDLL